MTTIEFEIDETQLPAHTPEELEEWLQFELGYRGDIDCENPLEGEILQASWVGIKH